MSQVVKLTLAVDSNGKPKPLTLEQIGDGMRDHVAKLRQETIPVGRAAASTTRALAGMVPASLSSSLREQQGSGALRAQFDLMRGKNEDPFDAAVGLCLEVVHQVKHELEGRAHAFGEQSLRDEGKAAALEEQLGAMTLSALVTADEKPADDVEIDKGDEKAATS